MVTYKLSRQFGYAICTCTAIKSHVIPYVVRVTNDGYIYILQA